ncbi:hypothetical protein Hanom_Chr09g00787321 [Helianthus anomalus]
MDLRICLIDTSSRLEKIYDRYGNRTGIRSWAYNDEKGLFLVTRNNGIVEYYNSASAFESWTAVDLRELSQASYHDQ